MVSKLQNHGRFIRMLVVEFVKEVVDRVQVWRGRVVVW